MASLEVWVHFAATTGSILLGAVLLIRQKGDGLHKALGRTCLCRTLQLLPAGF